MPSAGLPSTTHTVEMAQITEINTKLQHHPSDITAAELGLGGRQLHGREHLNQTLPDSAVLARLCWEGPPDYPYIHAHFSAGAAAVADAVVDLHTEALKTLSHRLSLHHTWGVSA
jgi:hypothetical protein